MKKFILVTGLLLAVLADPGYASPPLKVEISSPNLVGLTSTFTIATKIKNVSDQDQTIPIWECSYGWSWVASVPAIVTGRESCLRNVPGTITLKPGESHDRDLEVVLSKEAKMGSLTFKMGFNTKNDWIGTRRGLRPAEESLQDMIWSNPITIYVNPLMLASALTISETLEAKSREEFRLHGVNYSCSNDTDCPCQNFNGSYYEEGTTPGKCDQEKQMCAPCTYKNSIAPVGVEKLEVKQKFTGLQSNIAANEYYRITDDKTFQEIWSRHSASEPTLKIDFSQDMVIAIFQEKTVHQDELQVDELINLPEAINIIFQVPSYQVMGDYKGEEVKPFGFFVMTRSNKKLILTLRTIHMSGDVTEVVVKEFQE
jgi:hypothetical protein